ncbi:MAG: hypothetical protein H6626_02410 [Pseudobdellovibrionaceae bacterium]|nr:hypothetical protein [Bdellovibrionales bacterium]USN47964.1 MAG: hypothetical protein H6626_02410 [Pseudobdellovibrionaceae bacterium]
MGYTKRDKIVELKVSQTENQIKRLYNHSQNVRPFELSTYLEALSHIETKREEVLSCLKLIGESRRQTVSDQRLALRNFQKSWKCLCELIASLEFYYARPA